MASYRLTLAFALTCAACAAEPEALDGLAPIAELPLDNGNTIEFYANEDGLYVSELGIYPNPPTPVEDMAPSDVYRTYAADREIPAALLDAEARAGIAPAPGPIEPLPLPATPDAPYAGPCNASWFASNFCQSGWDFQMCLTNWWNGAWAQINNAIYHYTVVCPFKGNVVLSIANQGIWTVDQGTYRWASRLAGYSWFDWNEFWFRADITHASGDGFHFHTRVATD